MFKFTELHVVVGQLCIMAAWVLTWVWPSARFHVLQSFVSFPRHCGSVWWTRRSSQTFQHGKCASLVLCGVLMSLSAEIFCDFYTAE